MLPAGFFAPAFRPVLLRGVAMKKPPLDGWRFERSMGGGLKARRTTHLIQSTENLVRRPSYSVRLARFRRAGNVRSNLARPGGNITGTPGAGVDILAKQLELVRTLLRNARSEDATAFPEDEPKRFDELCHYLNIRLCVLATLAM
jgi:hypothetical protein